MQSVPQPRVHRQEAPVVGAMLAAGNDPPASYGRGRRGGAGGYVRLAPLRDPVPARATPPLFSIPGEQPAAVGSLLSNQLVAAHAECCNA